MTAQAQILPSAASAIAPSILVPPEYYAQLAECFSGAKDLSGMLVEDALAARGDHLVIIDLRANGALPLLEAIARLAPETKVLVISDALSASAVRAMLKLQASDISGASASPRDIVKMAGRLMDVAPDTPAQKNQCWVVTGAVGGAGTTTIAIELACATAMRDSQNSVCLVDLNLADGMIASYLEGENRLDLLGLAEAPDRLDQSLLNAYCWEHATGVTLISASRNPDVHEFTNANTVLRLLDTICSVYTHVIVDMPRERRDWSKPILAGVDEVLVVSEFTVPSLHAAADMTREVDALRGDAKPSRLVLNRMSDGKREFSVQRASKAIEREIGAVIRSDWKSAREAVNLGMPVAEVKPKSMLVKDVMTLLKQLDPALTETGKKRMWK